LGGPSMGELTEKAGQLEALARQRRAEQTRAIPAFFRPEELRRRFDNIGQRAADDMWALAEAVINGQAETIERLTRERNEAREDVSHGQAEPLGRRTRERSEAREHAARVDQQPRKTQRAHDDLLRETRSPAVVAGDRPRQPRSKHRPWWKR